MRTPLAHVMLSDTYCKKKAHIRTENKSDREEILSIFTICLHTRIHRKQFNGQNASLSTNFSR